MPVAFADGRCRRLRSRWRTDLLPLEVAAIGDDLDTHDTDRKPVTWTASAESIIEKVELGRAALKQASGQ